MRVIGISRDLLDLLLEMGKDRHPYEFVGLLSERDGVIDQISLVPGTISGETSASVWMEMMPLDTHKCGSAHSHPNGVLYPSDADLSFFPRAGRFNLIIGYPYNPEDWICFTADGQRYQIEVIA